MSLKQVFTRVAKKAALALCVLSTVFMAACGYPSHQLGRDPGLQGTTVAEVMFDGAAAGNHITVDGSTLLTKNHYDYTGSVTINGNVPAKTEISIANGRLEVTGNVGSGSEITVQMPVRTHTETYHYTSFIMVGKVMVPQSHTGHRTVVDGLLYPSDQHAAVKVDGSIGNKVTIRANGGIEAAGWGTELKVETGYGRPLRQTPNGPAFIVPSS